MTSTDVVKELTGSNAFTGLDPEPDVPEEEKPSTEPKVQASVKTDNPYADLDQA